MSFKKGSRSDQIKAVIFLVSLAVSISSNTEARAALESEQSIESTSIKSFYLSASLSTGTASLSSASGTAISTSGSQSEALLMGSYHFNHFILEGGIGFLRNTFSGGAGGSVSSSGLGSDFSLTAYEQSTQCLVAEFSPQYRLTDHLQVGPLGEMLFGTDVSLIPGFSSDGQSTSFMAGGQALYGFSVSSVYLRAGARYLTSLGLESERSQSIQATLQIGLPIF